jgi:hypothetical protein
MLVTGELVRELGTEPHGTDRWVSLANEAWSRAKTGSLHPRHVPPGHEPSPKWLAANMSPEDLDEPVGSPGERTPLAS